MATQWTAGVPLAMDGSGLEKVLEMQIVLPFDGSTSSSRAIMTRTHGEGARRGLAPGSVALRVPAVAFVKPGSSLSAQ